MTPIELTSAQQDEAAVAAVQRGDAERYRELVERHERRVFAVAWSRLGDAALAEEVTQEAFIRAYRRLWLIGDGAKFAGWVSAIARRTAINLGLRQRRELDRRERWALEQFDPVGTPPASEAPDPLYTPETLRQTLAELPSAHRECLVLFYLEGKSGAEAAAVLGISESALRVRLHRARAALRERLEDKLAGSLAKLRPSQALVPAVMAGVLASASAKAAAAGGVGSAIFAALGKFTPFKWLFLLGPLLLPTVMVVPGWLLSRWLRRDEQRNFCDPAGFRANLHNLNRRFDPAPWLFLLVIPAAITAFLLDPSGMKGFMFILGLVCFALAGIAARQLQINRKWSSILAPLLNNLAIGVFCWSIWWGRVPALAISLAAFFSSCLMMFSARSRLVRMDGNLFLRAAQGQLPPVDAAGPKSPASRFDRTRLRAFARFLGERELAINFRWGARGLTLYLPAVKTSWRAIWSVFFPLNGTNSTVMLGWDGSVTALCRKPDAVFLQALAGAPAADPATLEQPVAAAVAAAWRHFRAGNIPQAERFVGQIPDAEIFVVAPDRIRAYRWQRAVFLVLLTVSLSLWGADWLLSERLSGMKPVALTEAQIRAFMNDPSPAPDRMGLKANSVLTASFFHLVLPPTNLFSPEKFRAMRAELTSAHERRVQTLNQPGADWIGGAPGLARELVDGWLTWEDLGLNQPAYAEYLRIHQAEGGNALQFDLNHLLAHWKAGSWADQKQWQVERVSDFTLQQLRLLRQLNCLELLDRDQFIRQIAALQDLSATPAPGQPPLHDWRAVRGLFFTPGYPALQHTYFALAALEILGGLDRIDREACIQGILGRHEGRGLFTSPGSGGYNEYAIDGGAHDTIAAFESLRILGALDQVKDLDRWEFRVPSSNASKPAGDGVHTLTWDDVEAWVCQQRLAKIVQERREHPEAPVRSLLEP